jgi:hypothetical protein
MDQINNLNGDLLGQKIIELRRAKKKLNHAKNRNKKVKRLIESCKFCSLKKRKYLHHFKHSRPDKNIPKIKNITDSFNELLHDSFGIHMAKFVAEKHDGNHNTDYDFDVLEAYTDKTKSLPIDKVLYFKDTRLMSDDTYSVFISAFQLYQFPTLYSLCKFRKNLNENLEIIELNERIHFVNVADKISQQIHAFLLREPDFLGNKIKIKLSGDGTQIGRVLKIINITFTIVSDPKKCKTAKGNYTLGIIIGKENGYHLKIAFNYVMKSIKNIKSFNFKNKKYEVEFFFGADWVFMAEVLGIQHANSDYPCLFCICAKLEFADYELHEHRVANDPLNYFRGKKLFEILIKQANSKGFVCESFMDFIDFKNCVIDTLHLFIRIATKLISLFVKELCRLDKYNGTIPFCASQHKNLAIFFIVFFKFFKLFLF